MLSTNFLKELPQTGVTSLHRSVGSAASVRGDIFNMKEIWENIIGFEGLYQMSNIRNVRSVRKGNRSLDNPLIIKQRINSTGYLCFSARGVKDVHKTHVLFVHREFAKIFIPNPLSLPEVNHIDGNKLNNKAYNLEWCDKLHNIRHAFKNGLIVPCNGINKPQAKLTEKQVLEIFNSKESGRKLAPKYGVYYTIIYSIRKGLIWNSVTGLPKKYKSVIP